MSRKQFIFNLLPRTASQADNFADRYRTAARSICWQRWPICITLAGIYLLEHEHRIGESIGLERGPKTRRKYPDNQYSGLLWPSKRLKARVNRFSGYRAPKKTPLPRTSLEPRKNINEKIRDTRPGRNTYTYRHDFCKAIWDWGRSRSSTQHILQDNKR